MILSRFSRRLFCLFILALNCNAWSATATLDEAGLDAIFSQAVFGDSPIDIRVLPVAAVTNDGLLSVDSSFEFLMFRNLVPSPDSSPEIAQVFFVDAVDSCAGIDATNIVGCASIGSVLTGTGDQIYYGLVESDVAETSLGASLIAHELSHNLGLGDTTTGLMGAMLDANTLLTASEANTILNSPLVRVDTDGQRFIEIAPVVISSSAVPEPNSGLLIVCLFSMVFGLHRRKRDLAIK